MTVLVPQVDHRSLTLPGWAGGHRVLKGMIAVVWVSSALPDPGRAHSDVLQVVLLGGLGSVPVLGRLPLYPMPSSPSQPPPCLAFLSVS